jgi:hypothetical protein
MKLQKLLILFISLLSLSGCASYNNMSESQKQEFWNGMAGGLQGASDALAEQNRRIAAEKEAQRKRQVNCETYFIGNTAYSSCK